MPHGLDDVVGGKRKRKGPRKLQDFMKWFSASCECRSQGVDPSWSGQARGVPVSLARAAPKPTRGDPVPQGLWVLQQLVSQLHSQSYQSSPSDSVPFTGWDVGHL